MESKPLSSGLAQTGGSAGSSRDEVPASDGRRGLGKVPKLQAPGSKLLSGKGINHKIVEMEYAVRGRLVARAQEIAKMIRMGQGEFPFSKVTYLNIGNPHSLGQPPLTFLRQVLAGCMYPPLRETMPADVAQRVTRLLDATNGGGVGAYSESQGLQCVRQDIAEFLERRDGHPGDIEEIFLTNGASDGVKAILNMMCRNQWDAVLVPIPQYPIYSASLTLNGARLEGYFLDELEDWGVKIRDMRLVIRQARVRGYTVRALVVINPGNPTGQVMTYQSMKDIVNLCIDEKIILLADEVYQENVYEPERTFTSFKKVVRDMGAKLELASFHSISKGITGECGLRGGFVELTNFSDDAKSMLLKLMSVSLCSTLPGQVAMDCMVNPPKEGDESYPLYMREREEIYGSLKRKAQKMAEALNTFEGITCNPIEGALYAFPRIRLPYRALLQAYEENLGPDQFYASRLLEATGICVVPGCGFGQDEGTFHFRTTILPPESEMNDIIERMRTFHANLFDQFADNTPEAQ